MKKATSIKLIHHINSKVKEPPKMIMFCWARYEATVNGVGYGQSQLLVMSVLPSEATFFGKLPIKLLAAPSGLHTSIQEMALSMLNISYKLNGNTSLLTVLQRGMIPYKE
jgi:hypothetical protein